MAAVTHYSAHTGTHEGKHYKTTLFEGSHLMVGVNCLEPGQEQPVHAHEGADKFYVVMEGKGEFSIGERTYDAAEGSVVWAPAGVPHGVRNTAPARLTLLVGIAPPPQ